MLMIEAGKFIGGKNIKMNLKKLFKNQKVLVIGDIILDKYIFGEAFKLSPEAPVPLIKVEKEEYRLGGASNVANNILALGGLPFLYGQWHTDDYSFNILKGLLHKLDCYINNNTNLEPIIKTRIISRNQQMLRFDNESNVKKELIRYDQRELKKRMGWADIIVISDYNKGTITQNLINFIHENTDKLVLIDPKPDNIHVYNNLIGTNTILKSNRSEYDRIKTTELAKQHYYFVTEGELGLTLYKKNDIIYNQLSQKEQVKDVVGAGDCVLALLALIIDKTNIEKIKTNLRLLNLIGQLCVTKLGTVVISYEELEKAYENMLKV